MVPNCDDHPKTDRCMRKCWHWSDRSQESGVILREGCIGVCKRRYGLDLVMMRLKHTSEVDIHAAILTRNLFRRLRLHIWLFLAALFRRSESTKTDTPVPLACLCG